MAMTGVVIAQLFRLQHALLPNPSLGFFVLGIPLASTFIGGGAVILLGVFRFWRQQSATIRGKVWAGGWEITAIIILIIVVSVMLFFLLLSVCRLTVVVGELSLAVFAFTAATNIEKEMTA
jgi:uncharacterized membrane protein YidH (DUF202 family)